MYVGGIDSGALMDNDRGAPSAKPARACHLDDVASRAWELVDPGGRSMGDAARRRRRQSSGAQSSLPRRRASGHAKDAFMHVHPASCRPSVDLAATQAGIASVLTCEDGV